MKGGYKKTYKGKSVKSVVGELRLHYDGYGFVVSDSPEREDVFIPARAIGYAMHRDIVEAQILPGRRGHKSEGRILRVIERGIRQVVGRFEKHARAAYVISDDLRVKRRILIPPEWIKNARHGQTVIVRITEYPSSNRPMTGMIVDVLGRRGEEDVETEVVIAKHELPTSFPKKVLEEASNVAFRYRDVSVKGRKDLRDKVIFTIDGENAKDFDDAVGIEEVEGGLFRLYVSIADVSYFVRWGSLLDKEAYERGTSTYFPHRCIPMLPPILSEDLCSLKPYQDRFTVTVELDISRKGEVVGRRFYRSVIRSRARLTYTEIRQVLVDKNPSVISKHRELVPHFKKMEELCYILARKRSERGSIDFDLPEPEIILDMEGNPENIVKAERNIAHRIIEEFMIVANEQVASFLTEKGAGCLYRVHNYPETLKLREFQILINNLGYKVHIGKRPHPRLLADILRMADGKPEERLINSMLLRSLAQAVYSAENIGHYGLASSCYCHFTSPIRRYPDLIVHRLLIGILDGESVKEATAQRLRLQEIAEHSSKRERISMEAEREMVSLYKAMFMREKIGMEFDGIVSHVTKFGLFVELVDFFVEGLVHVSTLKDDKYVFSEEGRALIGRRTKKRFSIGDRVRVAVEDVSIERREIDFVLC